MDSNIVNIPVFHLLVLSIFNHHHHEATNQVVAMIMMTMVIRTLKKWGFKVFFIFFLLIKKTKYSCISVVHFGNTHTKTQWLRLVFRLSDIYTDQYLKHTHTFGLWMKILCVCVCMWMSVKVHHTDWMNVNGEKTNDQDLASPHW